MTPQMPKPAPSAITRVCNTSIAELKNSIKLLSAASAACPIKGHKKRRSVSNCRGRKSPRCVKFCRAAVFSFGCGRYRFFSRGAYFVSYLFLCYCINSSFRCCSYRASHRFTNRRIAACRCCSRRSAMKISPFMASVIFLSCFFRIRLFMGGVLLQICFADFVIVKGFVRLHKGGSAP